MENIKVGDIVARKSYGCDVLFKVIDIDNNGEDNYITLKGICYRIQADALESDLIIQSECEVKEYVNRINIEAYKKLEHANSY